jgi:hypothetical protein
MRPCQLRADDTAMTPRQSARRRTSHTMTSDEL